MFKIGIVKAPSQKEGYALDVRVASSKIKRIGARVIVSGNLRDGLCFQRAKADVRSKGSFLFIGPKGSKTKHIRLPLSFVGGGIFPAHATKAVEVLGSCKAGFTTLSKFDPFKFESRKPRSKKTQSELISYSGPRRRWNETRSPSPKLKALRKAIISVNELAKDRGAVLYLNKSGKLGAKIKVVKEVRVA